MNDSFPVVGAIYYISIYCYISFNKWMLFRLLLNNLHNDLSISMIDMEHLIDNSCLPITLYMPGCCF